MVVRRTTIELHRCDCKGCRAKAPRRCLPLPRLRLGALLQLHDLALEVAEVVETLVDGREPHRRHRVELPEPFEDCEPDPLAANLVAARPRRFLDFGGERRRPRPRRSSSPRRRARSRRAPSRDRRAPARRTASPPSTAAPRPARRWCSAARTPGTPGGAGPLRRRRRDASRRPCRRRSRRTGTARASR